MKNRLLILASIAAFYSGTTDASWWQRAKDYAGWRTQPSRRTEEQWKQEAIWARKDLEDQKRLEDPRQQALNVEPGFEDPTLYPRSIYQKAISDPRYQERHHGFNFYTAGYLPSDYLGTMALHPEIWNERLQEIPSHIQRQVQSYIAPKTKALINAVESGDLDSVKTLIARGAHPNIKLGFIDPSYKKSALEIAQKELENAEDQQKILQYERLRANRETLPTQSSWLARHMHRRQIENAEENLENVNARVKTFQNIVDTLNEG
ncbi:MAG: hypothetical protein WC707_06490 [Candidatus Babeliaceae bacterium]